MGVGKELGEQRERELHRRIRQRGCGFGLELRICYFWILNF
jgi:hypothetical protein